MEIILASNSPRRKEILSMLNYEFNVIVSNCNEDIDLLGSDLVLELSKRKAEAVFINNKDKIVIGSDTIVYLNNKVYGKPKDKMDAFNMLKELSNKTHEVITGVTIMSNNNIDSFYDTAYVTFKDLTDKEIFDYIDTLEPMDKAGAYGIQGLGRNLIKEFKGDFYTIMGLPSVILKEHLDNFIKNENKK